MSSSQTYKMWCKCPVKCEGKLCKTTSHKHCKWARSWETHPMMRLSEYSFFLEKESARLKKLRAGNTMPRPGVAAPSRGGARVIRIPHDDRYLITKQTIMNTYQGEDLNQYSKLRANTLNSVLWFLQIFLRSTLKSMLFLFYYFNKKYLNLSGNKPKCRRH